jgi:DNA-nicking Smr family endonuclease
LPPSRRLSAEEAALWRKVAAGVRRLENGAPTDVGSEVAEGAPVLGRSTRPSPPAGAGGEFRGKPARAVSTKSGGPFADTLDGGWDRKLTTGNIAPEVTIDLHGCTLDRAHDRLDHGLRRAIADSVRIVLLVTGKAPRSGASRIDLPLRGIIRASVQDWLQAAPYADRIAAVRPAHPRHGGAGALYVILRRIRN